GLPLFAAPGGGRGELAGAAAVPRQSAPSLASAADSERGLAGLSRPVLSGRAGPLRGRAPAPARLGGARRPGEPRSGPRAARAGARPAAALRRAAAGHGQAAGVRKTAGDGAPADVRSPASPAAGGAADAGDAAGRKAGPDSPVRPATGGAAVGPRATTAARADGGPAAAPR